MPRGQFNPLSLEPVTAIPDGVPSGTRGGSVWVGYLRQLAEKPEGTLVEARRYDSPGGARSALKTILKLVSEGKVAGEVLTEEDGVFTAFGRKIDADVRRFAEGGSALYLTVY